MHIDVNTITPTDPERSVIIDSKQTGNSSSVILPKIGDPMFKKLKLIEISFIGKKKRREIRCDNS